MKAIAIIPARGGSQRIPGKNWKDFHGKPIIQYSIETAIKSGLFDQVVVTTDGPEIAEAAMRAGAMVVWRSEAMAKDHIGTQEVASTTLALFRDWLDYACCIYPTAPMMTVEDLKAGHALLANAKAMGSYCMSVGTEPLRDAGQWYWGTAQAFLDRHNLIGPRTILYPIAESRVRDINTQEDWDAALIQYDNMTRREKP